MNTAQDTDRLPARPAPFTSGWTHAPIPVVASGGARLLRRRRPLRSELWRWALVAAIWLPIATGLLGLSLIAAIYWQAGIDQTRPVDAIVVLGTAQYDGRPGPVLQARLDEALIAYQAGAAPLIVVTGGRQEGDRFTEAAASRDYLVANGVPERAILLEDEGRSSWESMQGAASLLDARDLEQVLLVSDGFHLLRLKLMARELGLAPVGAPAAESPIRRNSGAEFDYVVREAGGIIAFVWRHGP